MLAFIAVSIFLLGAVVGAAVVFVGQRLIRQTVDAQLERSQSSINHLVTPIREGLERYDRRLHEIELDRVESFAALGERLDMMSHVNEVLRGETSSLARALTSSNVRGAWGELQLRRVVELAGMLEHCDFDTQLTIPAADSRIRPDMVINLPGGRTIVVDAKTPASALLEAAQTRDEVQRRSLCDTHLQSVKRHIDALSRKAYWEQFATSPEFVVMFLPSEAFFSIALEFDPQLFEKSFEQRVIVATPTTLIAMLKAIAFGWRQETIAHNAQEISNLGRELYERIIAFGSHVERVGDHLGKAVLSYNRAVNALERRVLPSARKFESLGVARARDLPEPKEIGTAVAGQPDASIAARTEGSQMT